MSHRWNELAAACGETDCFSHCFSLSNSKKTMYQVLNAGANTVVDTIIELIAFISDNMEQDAVTSHILAPALCFLEQYEKVRRELIDVQMSFACIETPFVTPPCLRFVAWRKSHENVMFAVGALRSSRRGVRRRRQAAILVVHDDGRSLHDGAARQVDDVQRCAERAHDEGEDERERQQ